MAEFTLSEKVVLIDESLTAARVPHAFGGALALGYYAEPRATFDVDVNLFVPATDWGVVGRALGSLGVEVGGANALERDEQARWWWGETPVDLFFSYNALHTAMATEAHPVPFAETRIPILAAEHLAVCKALFDRVKDWLDIEQMLAVDGHLDVDDVRRWLEEMVGADDERVRRFDELVARVR